MHADAELIAAAQDAATRAYAPYSNFAVGAALRLTDGSIVTGANVENASYGLSLCAETVAIAKVANAGQLSDVAEVAVIGLFSPDPIYPCGRCRQLLWEHGGPHCLVDTPQGIKAMSWVLPEAFDAAKLA